MENEKKSSEKKVPDNNRCNKKVYKKYRFYRSDIWSKLTLGGHNNHITRLLAKHVAEQLKLYLWTAPARKKKYIINILKKFEKKKPESVIQPPLVQVKSFTIFKRRKLVKTRGRILKLRKQLSLFYGGGLIRSKTFRRYSDKGSNKTGVVRELIDNKPRYVYGNKDTYGSFLESRVDVFLVRSQMIDTIYHARQLIFHRKIIIGADKKIKVPHPSYRIKLFQVLGLDPKIYTMVRHNLRKKIRTTGFIGIPYYMYVNFALLIAFKIEEPQTGRICYPFTPIRGGCQIFQKAFKQAAI